MERLTKDEMLERYEVLGFAINLCVVERKLDGVRGTLAFSSSEGVRYYYAFQAA